VTFKYFKITGKLKFPVRQYSASKLTETLATITT